MKGWSTTSGSLLLHVSQRGFESPTGREFLRREDLHSASSTKDCSRDAVPEEGGGCLSRSAEQSGRAIFGHEIRRAQGFLGSKGISHVSVGDVFQGSELWPRRAPHLTSMSCLANPEVMLVRGWKVPVVWASNILRALREGKMVLSVCSPSSKSLSGLDPPENKYVGKCLCRPRICAHVSEHRSVHLTKSSNYRS